VSSSVPRQASREWRVVQVSPYEREEPLTLTMRSEQEARGRQGVLDAHGTPGTKVIAIQSREVGPWEDE
jgi:hypothetical protein